MNTWKSLLGRSGLVAAPVIVISLFQTSAMAAELSLADVPLFVGGSVPPNLLFMVDDSGSMDSDILTGPHWEWLAYDPDIDKNGDFDSTQAGSLRTDGRWYSREYDGSASNQNWRFLYTNADDMETGTCTDGGERKVEECGGTMKPYDADWRVRSSGLNRLYYNPDADYGPWVGPCFEDDGSLPTEANGSIQCNEHMTRFVAALSNPREGYNNASTRNLGTSMGGFVYEVWIDDAGYSGSRPQRGDNFNNTGVPNQEIDLWDSHIRVRVTASSATVEKITYDPNKSTEHPQGLNETITALGTLSGTSCYNALGDQRLVKQIFDGTLATTSTDAVDGYDKKLCRTLTEAQQNIANWYTFHRRRSFVAKSAIAQVVEAQPGFRYGLSLLNQYNSVFKQVPSAQTTNFAQHNADMLSQFFAYEWTEQATPLRKALQRAGDYFDANLPGKTDPIIASCQKNYSLLFTDGFYNGNDPSGIGDKDGDGINNTLADVAHYYYHKDLSSLPDEVVPDAFDDATHQHMVTYAVAFGVTGNLTDANKDGWPNIDGSDVDSLPDDDRTLNESGQVVSTADGRVLVSTTGGWGAGGASNPEKIDDLWHAAYNGRGLFAFAGTPKELTNELLAAISNINDRVGSASSVSLNTGSVRANSLVYQAKFDSTDWTGQLLAKALHVGSGNSGCRTSDPIGVVCPNEIWDAGCVLTGGSCSGTNEQSNLGASRQILTYNTATNTGIPLQWSDLSSAQQDVLNLDAGDITDSLGPDRLDYLRGARTMETSSGGPFRDRRSLLGDIVHSNPLYVGVPVRRYPETWTDKLGGSIPENDSSAQAYSDFKAAYADRVTMVYAGANDGFLHGFASGKLDSNGNLVSGTNDGKELLAYMPSKALAHARHLTYPTYAHRYYVDGAAVENEVFFGGAGGDDRWHSVLVGALGGGGQGLYALDITDPDDFDETNAADLVLWEFTDADDHDLGYTIGKSALVRLHNGKWAVIVGNGYNSTQADGAASTTGNGVLYVLDVTDGSIIRKLDTGVGTAQDPTGQDRPNGLASVFPVDKDADFITDYVYVGDLFGNVWRFDLTDTQDLNWKVSEYGELAPTPLFSARDPDDSTKPLPITTQVQVGAHPNGVTHGVLVYFGTGKYMETGDAGADTRTTHTFYAIWDKDFNGVGASIDVVDGLDSLDKHGFVRGELQQQSIDDQTTVSGDTFRTVTANSVAWADGASGVHGWYLNLKPSSGSNQGEMLIADPVLRGKAVVFSTFIPSGNACAGGGSGFLMVLDSRTGGRTQASPFDVNNDGTFTIEDMIDFDGPGKQIASGINLGGGASTPGFVLTEGQDRVVLSKFNGALEDDLLNVDMPVRGRQTWRQLR